MPLRGSLFRKLQKVKKEREKSELKRFKKDVINEAQTLKKLRTRRIREEGRALLKNQIEIERTRIKVAKGPRKTTALESFLKKQSGKAAKAGAKELKKRRARLKAGKPLFKI